MGGRPRKTTPRFRRCMEENGLLGRDEGIAITPPVPLPHLLFTVLAVRTASLWPPVARPLRGTPLLPRRLFVPVPCSRVRSPLPLYLPPRRQEVHRTWLGCMYRLTG